MSDIIPFIEAASNYTASYKAFFGIEPPDVRRHESGGYSVLFRDNTGILRPKTYTASELVRITKFYQRGQ